MSSMESALLILAISILVGLLAWLLGPPKGDPKSTSYAFQRMYRGWAIFGAIVGFIAGLYGVIMEMIKSFQ